MAEASCTCAERGAVLVARGGVSVLFLLGGVDAVGVVVLGDSGVALAAAAVEEEEEDEGGDEEDAACDAYAKADFETCVGGGWGVVVGYNAAGGG